MLEGKIGGETPELVEKLNEEEGDASALTKEPKRID